MHDAGSRSRHGRTPASSSQSGQNSVTETQIPGVFLPDSFHQKVQVLFFTILCTSCSIWCDVRTHSLLDFNVAVVLVCALPRFRIAGKNWSMRMRLTARKTIGTDRQSQCDHFTPMLHSSDPPCFIFRTFLRFSIFHLERNGTKSKKKCMRSKFY